MMRHSAGALLAAAAISGETRAEDALPSTTAAEAILSAQAEAQSGMRTGNADESKKNDDEKKKEEQRDPCPACGRG